VPETELDMVCFVARGRLVGGMDTWLAWDPLRHDCLENTQEGQGQAW
jgi:hypothetical protein